MALVPVEITAMSECFALYRFPYSGKCTLMHGDGVELLYSYSDLTGRMGYVFAPFKITETHPLLIIRPKSVETFDLSGNIESRECLFLNKDILRERTVYGKDFRCFHKCLMDGTFLKVVLSRSSEEQAEDDINPVVLFKKACALYPRMFISLVSTPQYGTWLMATPEILLENKKDKWHTMALAGTMKPKDEELLSQLPDDEMIAYMSAMWDKKNIREQQYVAHYIDNILERYSENKEVKAPHTVRAGALFHLVTDFVFKLKSEQMLGQLIEELHPTPAVCGIPKNETYKYILDNETNERSYYSGFSGPIDYEGATHLYVTLRCMRIDGRKYLLYAGGGLLKDSEEQSEWLETEAKMETMRKCLAIKRI